MKKAPFPLLPITSLKTLELCQNLSVQKGDLFICSYPKSGTTWTQHIVLSLLLAAKNERQSSITPYEHVSDYAPFFEIDPHWNMDTDELEQSIQERHLHLGRRVFNTHLRWDMLPKGNGAKYIYLIRSPLDVCVSFYHHLSNQAEGQYTKGLDDFFSDWVDGKISFGSWAEHVQSFFPALRHGPSREVLILCYDNMIENLPSHVQKISDFLSCDVPENKIYKIIKLCSFDSMRHPNNINRFQPKSVTWLNEFKFLRKGTAGDAKNFLSNKQFEVFKRKLEAEKEFLPQLRECFGTEIYNRLFS